MRSCSSSPEDALHLFPSLIGRTYPRGYFLILCSWPYEGPEWYPQYSVANLTVRKYQELRRPFRENMSELEMTVSGQAPSSLKRSQVSLISRRCQNQEVTGTSPDGRRIYPLTSMVFSQHVSIGTRWGRPCSCFRNLSNNEIDKIS